MRPSGFIKPKPTVQLAHVAERDRRPAVLLRPHHVAAFGVRTLLGRSRLIQTLNERRARGLEETGRVDRRVAPLLRLPRPLAGLSLRGRDACLRGAVKL